MTPRIGPPKYRAPEVNQEREYGLRSDIYGFGVMCQQLVGKLKKRRRRAMGDDVDWILDLGAECTSKDPARRPTAAQCLKWCVQRSGRSLRLCSEETARRRVTYRLTDEMDGGTWKHARGGASSSSGSEETGFESDVDDAAEDGFDRDPERGCRDAARGSLSGSGRGESSGRDRNGGTGGRDGRDKGEEEEVQYGGGKRTRSQSRSRSWDDAHRRNKRDRNEDERRQRRSGCGER